MKRYFFLQLIEKYYQLKKKAGNKKGLLKLYIEARRAGNTNKEIRQGFDTIKRIIGG